MSYCLNPVCTQPQNSDVTFCQSCGAKLLLRERYRAVRQIGQGGFGKTFLAVDQDLPNKPACVIKQFSPQIQGASGLQKATELFEQEAVQLNILGKHPQIPELLAHFEQDGRLYLVQEYVKGRNLAEELAQDGAFSEPKIRELLVGLLPVLQYIHDNQVIHRDIKPENIIRRDDGMLFLVDFGAVKLMTGTALLGTGTVIGDPRYMSPEQLRGKADGSSDLYALGVTCLHLITDVDPLNLFDDAEGEWVWRDYLSSVSSGIAALLDKMVVRAMKKRYISASKVLSDLGVRSEIVVSKYSESQVTSEKVDVIQIQSLTPVQIGNKYGYENESGQVVTKLLFDYAKPFSEGLAAVLFNDKWGFVNATGEFEINPQFDRAYSFGNGLARVKVKKKYYFINKKGDVALRPNFKFIGDFKEGVARIAINPYEKKRLYQFGTSVIDYFDSQNEFDEIWENLVGKYGFINTNGDLVIDPQYDIAFSFHEGMAIIGVGEHRKYGDKLDEFASFAGKYGFIDKNGKIIINPIFEGVSYFKNGVARFSRYIGNEIYQGFIDKSGKVIFQIKDCYELNDFSDGLAAFKNTDIRWGYVDWSGNVVIKPKFWQVEPFKNGYAKVETMGNWFSSRRSRTIDKAGKFVD
ncbi:WG repeat-containing protein [Pseudanabaena sp. UWO310]|uniref:WG repeat-containing protein n=1 Tax=Pseudanabaena sp. UWO310 TaxID=2480795 RepID=UPI001158C76C|nr:WG repeat-containing protein [Pseudanabaena sp. UWO310]TYQ29718.1 protein kinase [Pseudanabaena sp. UWO310]